MQRETFDAAMGLLTKQWPAHQLSPDVYWRGLQNMDDEVFKRAILACLETCRFFPVIAEIREKALALLNTAGLLPPPGEDAWAQVLAALREWHPDLGWLAWNQSRTTANANGPCPLPPLVEQAVLAMGGMGVVWGADGHERGFIRRDFISFYDCKRMAALMYHTELMTQALPAPADGLLGTR